MNKAKELSVTKGLSGAGAANDVLMAIYEWFGVKGQQRTKMEVYADGDEGGTYAGIYLKNPKDSPTKRQSSLKRATGSNKLQAWVGYFASEGDEVTRSVLLYSPNAKSNEALQKRILPRFPEARLEPDGKWHCTCVEATATASPSDFEWFTSVFEAAGVQR